jgi:hypothetical protein
MPAIINGRYCGSCEYWSGSRITCQGGRAVQCSSTGDKGICLYKTMSKTIRHQANKPACPRYIQWSGLK